MLVRGNRFHVYKGLWAKRYKHPCHLGSGCQILWRCSSCSLGYRYPCHHSCLSRPCHHPCPEFSLGILSSPFLFFAFSFSLELGVLRTTGSTNLLRTLFETLLNGTKILFMLGFCNHPFKTRPQIVIGMFIGICRKFLDSFDDQLKLFDTFQSFIQPLEHHVCMGPVMNWQLS